MQVLVCALRLRVPRVRAPWGPGRVKVSGIPGSVFEFGRSVATLRWTAGPCV